MKNENARKSLNFFSLSALAAFAIFLAIATCCPGLAFAEDSSGSSEEACNVTISGTYHQTEAYSMLAMVNNFRTATPDTNDGNTPWLIDESGNKKAVNGLSALKWDYGLEKLAMKRAAEIAAKFAHTRPNGEDCYSVNGDFSFESEIWGENIAMGQTSAEKAFVAWREDDKAYSGQGHRRNMLRDWTRSNTDGRIAIACFEADGICYWAMEFGVSDVTGGGHVDGDQDVEISLLPSQVNLSEVDSISKSAKVGNVITAPDSIDLTVYSSSSSKYFAATLSCSLNEQSWKLKEGSGVASIDGFKISALSPGTATFETTVLGKTVSMVVTVKEKATPVITGIPSSKKVDLSEGAFPLDLTCDSDGARGFSSSDESVATVDGDGKVTPKRAGTTNITVTYGETDDYKAASATCKVTVLDRLDPTLTLPAAVEAKLSKGAFPLELICNSDGARSFSSSNKSVATVSSDGKVTPKRAGTTNIAVTYGETDDYKAIRATCRVTVVDDSTTIVPGSKDNVAEYVPDQSDEIYYMVSYDVYAPSKTSITKLAKAKKAFTVKWKKKSGVAGYQIRYSLKSSMKGAKTVTVKSGKTTSKKIKKLKKKKKYYVQVRSYKLVDDCVLWSDWSAKKSVKTK